MPTETESIRRREMGQELQIVTPGRCDKSILQEFERIVVVAGKVTQQGLGRRIVRARLLALLSVNGLLAGTGGLKVPEQSYREKISGKAGIDLKDLDIELGWIAVLKEHQGQGMGPGIVSALLSQPEAGNAFATCEVGNMKIQEILGRQGFCATGRKYSSSDGERTLMVMLRPSNEVGITAPQGVAGAT